MRLETVSASFSEAWELIKSNSKGLFFAMARIELFGAALFMLCLLVAGALIALAMGMAPGLAFDGVSVVVLVGAALGVFLIGALLAAAAGSVEYNAIDRIPLGRNVGIVERASANLVPILLYSIVGMLIAAVTVGPILAIYVFVLMGTYESGDAGSQLAANIAEILFRMAEGLVGSAVYLFVQFAIFELIISGKGVLDSYGRSFGMVRRNFWETAAFSFALWLVEIMVSVPFVLIMVGIVFLAIFAATGLLAGAALPLAAAALAVMALAFVVVLIAYSALNNMVLMSVQYCYWKKIRGEKPEAVAATTKDAAASAKEKMAEAKATKRPAANKKQA